MTTWHRLQETLARLPGVGRRTAERMAARLVREREGLLRELVQVLEAAYHELGTCRLCGNVTPVKENPCRLCEDPGRDTTVLCVVEDPDDIVLLERSGAFRGRYHALMGKVSPMRGEGPSDLRLRALLERLNSGDFREIILALSTDVEGDNTAAFIRELLRDRHIRVTRLAWGLPAGSGVRYSDPVTLARAIQGRQSV